MIRTLHTPTSKAVCAVVARRCGVPAASLWTPTRRREIARARQLAMALLIDLTPWSMSQVARVFGLDHTTAMHARTRVEQLRRDNPAFATLWDLARDDAMDAMAGIPATFEPAATTPSGAKLRIERTMDVLRDRLRSLAHRDPVELAHRLTQLVVEMETALDLLEEKRTARALRAAYHVANPREDRPCAA